MCACVYVQTTALTQLIEMNMLHQISTKMASNIMNGVLVYVLPYKQEFITVVVCSSSFYYCNKLLVQVTALEKSRDAFQHFSKVDNGKLNILRFITPGKVRAYLLLEA